MTEVLKYRKGDRVIGLGRNGVTWNPRPTGTVTAIHYPYIRVAWDDTRVEDDMTAPNLLPANWIEWA